MFRAKNPEIAKKRLVEIGFNSVPDSLSQIHKGQGTAGKYFHFLNGYLELIFVYDQNELEKNNFINKDLDFTERANFEKNGASPFSIALKLKDYNIEKIPFEKISYHQDWMEPNVNIYSTKNSKTQKLILTSLQFLLFIPKLNRIFLNHHRFYKAFLVRKNFGKNFLSIQTEQKS
ncbi:MAG: hypothetical protein ABJJ05_09285 [Maribacter litoralis]|uniref:hypothetical protein n=1 Tax=Maribacter litoralis TaxID=2059726 RepID=UPI003299B463